MRVNPGCWFEIYVQEMARARAFYEGVLGGQLQRLEGPDFECWAFPMDPAKTGCGGALIHIPGVPSGGNSTMIYFACDDCAVEEARVTACGGQLHRSKLSIGPYGFISLAVDTEGNMFGLHSMK
jgi:predicted enzyme related to lactoylglutathione lyase